jgi:hypothetical protein
VLRILVSQWYKPLVDGDGFAAADLDTAERSLGRRLPAALREWYELAGRRRDVWCGQDELLVPDALAIQDRVLVFYVENQGVVRWGIPEDSLTLLTPAWLTNQV